MTQASYRESPFLDHRIVRADDALRTLHFQEVGEAVAMLEDVATHFVFHNAFACSTLLTRYLDILDGPLLLREPNSLYELATMSRFAGMPMLNQLQHVEWGVLYRFVLRLLGRRYRADYPTIVKPTDGCNNLMSSLLTAHPDNRAVFIYTPLERFLVSVQRHQPRHEWVRVRVRELLLDVYKESGAIPMAPESLTISQSAALVWILHTDRYIRFTQSEFGARCIALKADDLIAKPEEAVWRLSNHFGLGYSYEQVAALLDDARVNVHSKAANQEYDKDRRERDFAAAYAAYGDEISRTLEWAAPFCASREPGAPLPNAIW